MNHGRSAEIMSAVIQVMGAVKQLLVGRTGVPERTNDGGDEQVTTCRAEMERPDEGTKEKSREKVRALEEEGSEIRKHGPGA